MIIPAFAVGRVEELLYWVKRLEEERRIPVLPVFVAANSLAHVPLIGEVVSTSSKVEMIDSTSAI